VVVLEVVGVGFVVGVKIWYCRRSDFGAGFVVAVMRGPDGRFACLDKVIGHKKGARHITPPPLFLNKIFAIIRVFVSGCWFNLDFNSATGDKKKTRHLERASLYQFMVWYLVGWAVSKEACSWPQRLPRHISRVAPSIIQFPSHIPREFALILRSIAPRYQDAFSAW